MSELEDQGSEDIDFGLMLLRDALSKCWDLVPDETSHPHIPYIKAIMTKYDCWPEAKDD